MAASALGTRRIVTGSLTKIFLEGVAFTSPAAGVASAAAKPDIDDTGWIDAGPMKWTKKNTSKTEDYMSGVGGPYMVEDVIALSRGQDYTTKIEKQSPLAVSLQDAPAAPLSDAGATTYNPLAGSPVLRAWVHKEDRDQFGVLLKTTEVWCALFVDSTNEDDKATETGLTARVLFSTLNVGTLA
jgi:hypothetical protein